MYKRTVNILVAVVIGLLLAGGLMMGSAAAEDDQANILAGPKINKAGPSSERRFDGERRRGQRHQRMHQMMGQLNLTQEQKAQAKNLLGQHREQMESWRQQNRQELDDIANQMRQLHERQKKLMEKAPKMAAALEQLRPMLNDEQQEALDAQIEKMKQRHGNRQGRQGTDGFGGRRGKRGQQGGRDFRNTSNPRNQQKQRNGAGNFRPDGKGNAPDAPVEQLDL